VQIEKSEGKDPKSIPAVVELPMTYGTVPDDPQPLTEPVMTDPAVTFPALPLPVMSPHVVPEKEVGTCHS